MNPNGGLSNGSEGVPEITIPDHELLRVIGQGSYGQVWIARNTIGTYRAVKIINRSSFQRERPFEREIEGIRRFEPISRTHPGLVAILHVGLTSDGNCFYYVMELGDDVQSDREIDPENYEVKTLSSALWDQGRLPVDRCIDLGLSLSDALAYLHSNDLIHRDVKPANIIFVSGYPKLADIGLVAETSTANTYVGTEGFIPPEGPNSEQGDVFSLGKTLYEISTGQDRNQFPSLPASFSADASESSFVELIEIISQACHHDTSVRYPSARAMHAEITALANGRSIRRLRLLERRMLILTRAAKLAALVLLPLIFIVFVIQQEWQRRIRDTHREIGLFEGEAASALNDGDYAKALRQVSHALDLAPRDEENQALQQLRIASILSSIPKLTHFWVADASVNSIEFDGAGDHLFAAGDAGVVSRFSLSDEQRLSFKGHLGDVRGLDYHDESGLLLSAGQDEVIRLWDAESGKPLRMYRHPASLWAVGFSPNGKMFASGGDSNGGQDSVYLWDIENQEAPTHELPTPSQIWSVTFSSDGKWLAVGAGTSLSIWDTATGNLLRTLEQGSTVFDVLFIEDDTRIVTSAESGKFRIWNSATQAIEYESQRQNFGIRAVDESPDGRFLVTAGWDSIVRIWDRKQGQRLNPILRHSGRVNTVSYDGGGYRIATGASDGTIRVWNLAGVNLPRRYWGKWDTNHQGYYSSIDSGRVRLRKAGKDIELPLINQGPDLAQKALLSKSNKHLVVVGIGADSAKRLRIVNLNQPDEIVYETEIQFEEEIHMVDVHEGERRCVVVGTHMIQLVPIETSEPLLPVSRFDQPIARAFLSHSGKELFVQTKKEVLILETSGLSNRVLPIRTGNEIVYSQLSPSGSVLGITESDNGLAERSAFLYRYMETNKPYAELRHRDGVKKLDFRPDEKFVITAREDTTSVMWEFESGKPTERGIHHDSGINGVSFSQDGRFVVTGSTDSTVQLSDSESGFPISPAIRFPWSMDFGAFDIESKQIICQVEGGRWTWSWDVGKSDFPLDLLLRYVGVLCGDQLDRVSGVAPVPSSWQEATRLYPEVFVVSDADILAWHRWQAFYSLLSLYGLADRYSREEIGRIERAENFHVAQIRELAGRVEPEYEKYRQYTFNYVRSTKTLIGSE